MGENSADTAKSRKVVRKRTVPSVSKDHHTLYSDVLRTNLAGFGEFSTAEPSAQVQVDFPYNINTAQVETDANGSGGVTQVDGKAVISTGTTAGSDAHLYSKRVLNYAPGQGALARFAGFFTNPSSDGVLIAGVGSKDDQDGLFFGYNGSAFSVLRRSNGTDNWIAQADWNVDKADGTGALPALDWSKGNVFQIRFQWLGFGMMTFYVENPKTGLFSPVHRIQYANTATVPSVANPSFPMHFEAENGTQAQDCSISISSIASFTEGKPANLAISQAQSGTQTGVSGGVSWTQILTIHNKTTFASKTNRVRVELTAASGSNLGNKLGRVLFVLNGGFTGGSPVYTDQSTTESVIEYDATSGLGWDGTGRPVYQLILAPNESRDRDIPDKIDISINPGETLTVFGNTLAGGTSDFLAGMGWNEFF